LAGGVEDDVDERLFLRNGSFCLRMSRCFDEETVERAGVPLGEDVAHLGGLQAEEALHERVGSQIICISPYSIPLWTIFT